MKDTGAHSIGCTFGMRLNTGMLPGSTQTLTRSRVLHALRRLVCAHSLIPAVQGNGVAACQLGQSHQGKSQPQVRPPPCSGPCPGRHPDSHHQDTIATEFSATLTNPYEAQRAVPHTLSVCPPPPALPRRILAVRC